LRVDTVLIAILIAILFTGVGILLIAASSAVRRGGRPAEASRLKSRVRLFAWLLSGSGTLAILGTIAVCVTNVLLHEFVAAMVVGGIALAVVAVVFVFIGRLLSSVAATIGCRLSHDERRLCERKLTSLARIGWGFIVTSGFFVLLPTVIPAIMFVAVVLAVVVTTTAGRRRAAQGATLWHLAISVNKGLPLDEEVGALADGFSGRTRLRLDKLADLLSEGLSLPAALEGAPGVVPPSAVLAAQMGLESGTLGEALRDAATRYTTAHRWGGLQSSSSPGVVFWYFLVLPNIAISIVGFLMYWIIPKYKKIFEDFGLALPAITVTLIGASDFVVNYFYLFFPIWILPVVLLLYVGIGPFFGWTEFVPAFLGRWLQRFNSPDILKNLSRTIAAEFPLEQGLRTISEKHNFGRTRERVEQIRHGVEQGQNPWDAFAAARLINRRESSLLKSAEKVGNLPWALNQLAHSIDRRNSYRWQAFSELAQPAAVLLIGMTVLFICVAMFMPLIKMLHSLS
jgi:protein transport protein HofC